MIIYVYTYTKTKKYQRNSSYKLVKWNQNCLWLTDSYDYYGLIDYRLFCRSNVPIEIEIGFSRFTYRSNRTQYNALSPISTHIFFLSNDRYQKSNPFKFDMKPFISMSNWINLVWYQHSTLKSNGFYLRHWSDRTPSNQCCDRWYGSIWLLKHEPINQGIIEQPHLVGWLTDQTS